jgi:23S rRNA pseudouridine1911/1915/1917 synthase
MKIIYQDKNLLVIDKPAGFSVNDLETQLPENNFLIHRLDKETSGLLMIAKNKKNLLFFQKQFKNREIEKKYIALVNGQIKEKTGTIKTLIGRAKNSIKQKAYLLEGPERKKTGPRIAITKWKLLKKYKDYTLVEADIKTGRKHQIRVHFSYLGYPVVGDKLYSFKNQKKTKGLKRQFLHAKSIKVKMPNEKTKKFTSVLPKELKNILCQIK